MGALLNVSANAAKSVVNTSISAAITFAQTCSANLKNTQKIELNNCEFRAQSISASNIGVGVEKCAQDVSNRANIQAVVQQALHQAAEATAQQLGILDIGRAAANLGFNYSDIEQSLALAITEQFTVTCTAQFVSEQSFTCNNSRVYLSEGLNLHNYQQSLIDCTQRAVSTTNAFLQLQQILSQSAVAKEESLFSIYITIILIVIAVIVIIIIANQASVHSKSTTGALAVTNNRVTWICIGVVIIVAVSAIAYAWFASSNNWWPFLKPTNSNISGYQVG